MKTAMKQAGRRLGWIFCLLAIFTALPGLARTETLEQLISAARNEQEFFFVAGPTTFGGRKGLSEVEAAFNKRFGLQSRIRFSAGPEMNAMAARVISEYKSRRQSIDGYLSWLIGSICESLSRKRVGRSQLVRDLSMDRSSYGRDRFETRPIGLLIAARNYLQFQSDRRGQGAEKL